MKNYLCTVAVLVIFISACTNIPSSEDIEKDIATLEQNIKEANENVESYSGGLLLMLSKLRLETFKSTKAMLEQKKSGFNRFIPISYTIDGKKYSPPQNKQELLTEIDKDLNDLKKNLQLAEKESKRYGRGLLGVLSLTKVATEQNSIAFLNQRRILLKHDIPYYSILPQAHEKSGSGFKATPGKDIDKF